MLLVLALALVIGTALLLNAAYPAQGRLGNILALAVVVFGQIVLVTQVLSELAAIHAPGYLISHGFLFLLALVFWWRQGKPHLTPSRWFSLAEIRLAIRTHRLLAVFALVVVLVQIVNLALSFAYPVLFADALDYHLPRAYMWAQQHTARHYPTDDFRQVEFPPNASFCYLWLMVLAGATRHVQIAQWIAGWVTALAGMALARFAGHGRAAALFAGLLLLTAPNPLLQMATPYNDMLVAAPATCFLYFAFAALRNQADGRQNAETGYAGLALGLALGTKLTAFFILPGAGIALLIYGFWRLRRQVWRPVVILSVSSLIGFALFGSYNYLLNVLNYGSPVTTQDIDEASVLGQSGPRPELYGLGDNLIRYVYMTMDWSVLSARETNFLFQQNWRVFSELSRLLGLNPEGAQEFGFHGAGLRAMDFATSGFGPVIYSALLVSPALLAGFAWKVRLTPRFLISALLLLVVWTWLIVFAAITPWSPYRNRYFSVFIPALVAAVFPWLYMKRRPAWLWLLPVMALSTWTGMYALVNGHERAEYLHETFQGRFSYDHALGVGLDEMGFLRALLPPGTPVGIAGRYLRVFEVIDYAPEFRYVIMPKSQAVDRLLSGEVALVLSDTGWCESLGWPYLALRAGSLLNCALFPDPAGLLESPASVAYFRYMLSGLPSDRFLELDPAGALVHTDAYGIRMDIPGEFLAVGDLYIEVHFVAGALSQNDLTAATCSDEPVRVDLREDGLSLHLTRNIYRPNRILQRCQLVYNYNPRLSVAAVQVYNLIPPLPLARPDVHFANGLQLAGVDHTPAVEPCADISLTTWWQTANAAPGSVEVAIYVVDERGIAVAEQRSPLSGPGDGAQWMMDRRRIDVPCEAAPGHYEVFARVFAGADSVRITHPADVGTLAPLTKIVIEAGE